MSLDTYSCRSCGSAYFPARMRCHRCGGCEFDAQAITEGTVRGVTRVHRVPPGFDASFLAEVSTADGVAIVAVSVAPVNMGQRVALEQGDDGAVRITST